MSTFAAGDHQRTQLNLAIGDLVGIGQAAGSAGEAGARLVLAYVAVLERASPTVAIKYRGADAVHVTDDAQVERTALPENRHHERTADGQALALAHTLRADPNAADRIVCALDPADLLAFRAATAHLLDLVDVRARQLVQWRTIGPEAR